MQKVGYHLRCFEKYKIFQENLLYMLHFIEVSPCSFLIHLQLSVLRKASGGSSQRVRGSFHLAVF